MEVHTFEVKGQPEVKSQNLRWHQFSMESYLWRSPFGVKGHPEVEFANLSGGISVCSGL